MARRRCQWTYIPRALNEAADVDSVGRGWVVVTVNTSQCVVKEPVCRHKD